MVIRAAADGIVAYANNEIRGYGSCILIVHANGWVTLYAHQDRITVQPGYRVRRGERIGFVGATGRADGPHLHFELHVDGEAVDPRQYFEGEPWVRGRERLAVLRRNNGGHTYGHLGEIEADYGADAAPRPTGRVTARGAARTEGRVRTPSAAPARAVTPTRETAPERSASTARRGPTTTRPDARGETPAGRDPVAVREVSAAREPRESAAARETPAVREPRAELSDVTTPRSSSDFDRWFASGPTATERRTLRGHPITTYAAPIRVAATSEFRAGQLRYDAAVGTNVRAAATGRVVFVGRDVRGARTTVLVIHENGFISIYSGAMDTTVRVGALVEVGDRIGIVRDASFGFLFELLDRGQPLDPRGRFAVTPAVVAAR